MPYRGAAPAITDLVAGRIDIMFLNIGSARSHIDAGILVALGVSGEERLSKLPNVPRFREAGVPADQLNSGTWWGIIAPAKLPPAIRMQLEAAVSAALRDPQLRGRYDAMNVVPFESTSDQFRILISDKLAKWADVIQCANIVPD